MHAFPNSNLAWTSYYRHLYHICFFLIQHQQHISFAYWHLNTGSITQAPVYTVPYNSHQNIIITHYFSIKILENIRSVLSPIGSHGRTMYSIRRLIFLLSVISAFPLLPSRERGYLNRHCRLSPLQTLILQASCLVPPGITQPGRMLFHFGSCVWGGVHVLIVKRMQSCPITISCSKNLLTWPSCFKTVLTLFQLNCLVTKNRISQCT